MFKRRKYPNTSDVKPQPKKPLHIPENVQWLAGEGAGSWFNIQAKGVLYEITRYSPEGKVECQSVFKPESNFNINLPYEFTHISHCKSVQIIQNEKVLKFNLIE